MPPRRREDGVGREPATAPHRSPRPVSHGLDDYLSQLQLRARLKGKIKHDRVWSIGTPGEQLSLETCAGPRTRLPTQPTPADKVA